MDAIIDFFNAIGEVIVFVVDFVIQLFTDLIFMLELLAKFVVNIPTYLGWLPSAVVSIIVVIFSIVVIYKILGREG